MKPQLPHVRVAGFRSLQERAMGPGPVAVLVGPSGAGENVLGGRA